MNQDRHARVVKVCDQVLVCSFCNTVIQEQTPDGRLPDDCPGCRSKLDGTPNDAWGRG